MKAVIVKQLGPAENMEVVDMEIPSIGSKQILIRVKTTSVNYADIKARYGGKGGKLPFIPGLEAAGVVERVGDEVNAFQAGDRVLAFPHTGSYAEYIVADENLTFAIPDHMNFDTAGGFGIVSFLAYKLFADVARLEKGETVLIHAAAGGVGTTAIQVAKALGAGMVIGTVGSESKKFVALNAGADHVANYETEDFVEKVKEWTGDKGVNVILDSVAGEITEKSMKFLAHYGRLIIFGDSGGRAAQIVTSDLHASCRSVLGFSLGTTRKERPEILRAVADQVFRLWENGQLEIKVGEKFPLQEAALAHQWVESRKSTGKVLLYVDNEA